MNKFLTKTMLTLTAALMLVGGFSMTAYAQSSEPPSEETPVIEETAEPSEPLTPEGNANLVDDIWGENKQLITVTTKAGNYFYILIDRAVEGENTVHFLNQVDEADLMALIEDGGNAETAVMPQTCVCKEKCEAGAVNESCPVCLNTRASCTGKEAEKEPETDKEPEQPKDNGKTKSLLLLFVVTVLAGGGAFYYFKFLKPKDTAKGTPEFADFDFEDEDEEPDYGDEPEEETDTEETDGDTELSKSDTGEGTGDTL